MQPTVASLARASEVADKMKCRYIDAPYVVGTSTTATHSLGGNLQTVLALLKQNPVMTDAVRYDSVNFLRLDRKSTSFHIFVYPSSKYIGIKKFFYFFIFFNWYVRHRYNKRDGKQCILLIQRLQEDVDRLYEAYQCVDTQLSRVCLQIMKNRIKPRSS